MSASHFDDVEFEDGTNVPPGTEFALRLALTSDWYHPSESKAPDGWEDRWRRLRERFERIVDDYRPVEAMLVDRRIPAHDAAAINTESIEERPFIQFGPGLSCDFSSLITRIGQPLFSDFPIRDATGKPMCNSAGQGFAMRFGLTRTFSVFPGPPYTNDTRSLPGPRLMELATDAQALLYELPANVAKSIWINWPYGFARDRNADGYTWLDALFEMSWQSSRGARLHSERHAWHDNMSVHLIGQGLFPRLPRMDELPFAATVPNEHGYPFAWYAKIRDIARASVAAIDVILDRAQSKNHETDGMSQASRTMNASTHDLVFISYSHKDRKFFDDLNTHLTPYLRSGAVSAWSDQQIQPGSKWFVEIQEALSKSRVAVLLVSPGFLASDFICEHELTPLLKKAEAGGVTILWVLLRACAFEETSIKDYQAVVSPPAKPLAEMKAERDQAWKTICQAIKVAAERGSAT